MEKSHLIFTKEKVDALESLEKLNDGNTKYYEAGYAIHELASKASDIYKSPKATVEDKRLLLSKIFSNLALKQENIRPDYTLAFQFLKEWVPKVNNTFELENMNPVMIEDGFFQTHPVLLRG